MAGSMEGEVKITPRNSRGWRAVTETLTSIRAEIAHLQGALEAANADNERLRAELNAARDALREAPEPEDVDLGPNCCQRCDEYHIWYNGERVAALKGVLE